MGILTSPLLSAGVGRRLWFLVAGGKALTVFCAYALNSSSDYPTPFESLGGRGLTRGHNSSSGRLQRSYGWWWGILVRDHWEERPAWSEPEWCFAMFQHKVDHTVLLFVLIDRLKTSKQPRCEAIHYCFFNGWTRWTEVKVTLLYREISILYYLSMLNDMPSWSPAFVMPPQCEIAQHSSKCKSASTFPLKPTAFFCRTYCRSQNPALIKTKGKTCVFARSNVKLGPVYFLSLPKCNICQDNTD